MSEPAVTFNLQDNQLGIRSPGAGGVIALVGPAAGGALYTPAAYTRLQDVQGAHLRGPIVEAAAYEIEHQGRAVVLVRTAATGDAAAYGALTVTRAGSSTSVPAFDGATAADDEYEPHVEVVAGGSVGSAGITYKWSLDGGRTQSPTTALGTSTSIVFPDSGGVAIDLGGGTLEAGDVFYGVATPAWPSAAELTAGLEALRLTKLGWDFAAIEAPMGDVDVVAVDAKLSAMEAAGKLKLALGRARRPNAGESEADYRTAMETEFSNTVSYRTAICAGYCKTDSSITRRRYRRSPLTAVATRLSAVGPHIDIAELGLGALPAVRLSDANGNPDEHDESIYPGLDDLRLITLRTDDDYPGVFVTNPKLLTPPGSDFEFIQHRRIMDIACDVVRKFLKLRLSKGLTVDRNTGFILESEADDIEVNGTARLRNALTGRGWASGASIVVARDDVILSTKTLTVTQRVIPLAYPKTIAVTAGFYNPALQIVAA